MISFFFFMNSSILNTNIFNQIGLYFVMLWEGFISCLSDEWKRDKLIEWKERIWWKDKWESEKIVIFFRIVWFDWLFSDIHDRILFYLKDKSIIYNHDSIRLPLLLHFLCFVSKIHPDPSIWKCSNECSVFFCWHNFQFLFLDRKYSICQ